MEASLCVTKNFYSKLLLFLFEYLLYCFHFLIYNRKRYVNFINVLSKYLEVIKDETLPPLLKACL
jgi:hypothetical protein